MLNHIEMVALDLDGTLLDEQREISLTNQAALNEVIAQGVVVVVCTGRSIAGIPQWLKTNPGIRYLVSSNGASVYDNHAGKMLLANTLSSEKAHQIIAIGKPFANSIIDLYAEGASYVERHALESLRTSDFAQEIKHYYLNSRTWVDSFEELFQAQVTQIEKINFVFEQLDVKEAMKAQVKAIPDISITSSHIHNVEISHKDAHKGFGIRWLRNRLNIAAKHVMVMGDGENDLTMFAEAGLAVAMANANEHLKKVAHATTLSNEENGVASALRKYVLK